jgi:hypothetical protein
VAHANPNARWAHSIPFKDGSYAISYGGVYQPKTASELLVILVEVVLMYLTHFYETYYRKLELDIWTSCIELGHVLNENLKSWSKSLPHDWQELSSHAAEWETKPLGNPVPQEYRESVLRAAESMRAERLQAHRSNQAPEATA